MKTPTPLFSADKRGKEQRRRRARKASRYDRSRRRRRRNPPLPPSLPPATSYYSLPSFLLSLAFAPLQGQQSFVSRGCHISAIKGISGIFSSPRQSHIFRHQSSPYYVVQAVPDSEILARQSSWAVDVRPTAKNFDRKGEDMDYLWR